MPQWPACSVGWFSSVCAWQSQLNAALHRIALTQARWHPNAQAMIQRRRSNGDSGREAVRILKRRLSDAVFQALRTDQRELTTLAA
jgi:hypothetical protein